MEEGYYSQVSQSEEKNDQADAEKGTSVKKVTNIVICQAQFQY